MVLSAGTRFGAYEITGELGVGGMGEVYRATDTNLKRDVAIKVLPESFAEDEDRLARFQREAEVLASLNHPNIAQIYGLEKADGQTVIVMELVEGPTLADRIAEGAMPVDEALSVARQVADALEAAHGRQIVHRDLKPANIKLRSDGTVKVLDFGIATAPESAVATSGGRSPTLLTPALTAAGVLLGTAAYMSPEQAKGRPVDQRADIWAFGCVLYEMLTGQPAFAGEDVTTTLARVLEREANLDSIPGGIEPAVEHTLELCLEKDPARRIADIRDVRLALAGRFEYIAQAGAHQAGAARSASRRSALVGVVALALGAVAAGFAVWTLRPAANEAVVRSSITLPLDERLTASGLALSPDGRTLAFGRQVGGGQGQICLRDLNVWLIRCLPRTDGGSNPFFSPDGSRVGYTAAGELWSVSSDGALPIRLAETSGLGATWGRDDVVIFNPGYNQGLWRIAAPGESATQVSTPDSAKGELGHFWPQLLADGNTVLFTAFNPNLTEAQVAALRLDTGEIVPLVADAVYGRYVSSGHLLFLRSNTLMAVPFDVARLKTHGTPTPVMDDVILTPQEGATSLAISDTGTLAYVRESVANPERGLVWVDLQGNREALPGLRGQLDAPRLSPDGTRVALTLVQQANPDIYVYELDGGRGLRFTSKEGTQAAPIWTPDGSRIAFYSDEPPFDLFWQPADRTGTAEALRTSSYDKNPDSFSPDGSVLVFTENRPTETGADLWLLPLDGDREPVPFLQTEFNERNGQVSPDGRLIAYQSDETGRFEIYVRSFPGPAGERLVSTEGGTDPRWSRDGRTLFYRSEAGMMALAIGPGSPLVISQPKRLFGLESLGTYDVAADGRFLFVDLPSDIAPRQINIIQNWFEELNRLVPTE
jgi:Tol biopolymer transport system component